MFSKNNPDNESKYFYPPAAIFSWVCGASQTWRQTPPEQTLVSLVAWNLRRRLLVRKGEAPEAHRYVQRCSWTGPTGAGSEKFPQRKKKKTCKGELTQRLLFVQVTFASPLCDCTSVVKQVLIINSDGYFQKKLHFDLTNKTRSTWCFCHHENDPRIHAHPCMDEAPDSVNPQTCDSPKLRWHQVLFVSVYTKLVNFYFSIYRSCDLRAWDTVSSC